MTDRASSLLTRLEGMKGRYGAGVAPRRLALLRQLEHRALARASEVLRLHEALCVLHAYPDDAAVLAQVERMLDGFARRRDLRRHRRALRDTGIVGTDIAFTFFWFTARWLARRWPRQLSIDWVRFERKNQIEELLEQLLPYCETLTLDQLTFPPREWLRRVRGPAETDATFLIRRFEALPADSLGREKLYESLNIPIRLAAGRDTPSRTRAKHPVARVVFQTRPLSRSRPSLRVELTRPPVGVRSLSAREGERLIDLAREAMVTRRRDLDVFEHGNPDDVRLVECGDGLQFACIGALPERRLMLEAVYGFLTLKNGVPTGYVLASALFGSSEVAYNVFDTYRGTESAVIYGRVLAMLRHLFGSEAFTVDPYQLGYQNDEALRSGAWWFYEKLGFRPHDPGVRRVMRAELAHMKRRPRHRSSLSTLKQLAQENVFFYLGRSRADVLGRISPGNVGLRLTRYLAERFGADRERGARTCSRDAARLLGVGSLDGFSAGERRAWERWSPLVMVLPGVDRWSPLEKRALARVVRAKGGRRESDFVILFDRHRRLSRAVLALAEEADPGEGRPPTAPP